MHDLNIKNDKLDNIVNKYDNMYQRTIKMKLADVKSSTYINTSKEIKKKQVNLKLVILLEIKI